MPRINYYLPSGTRLTGTTTILSRFKDSGGLLHWAWKQGDEGKTVYEERDRAATAGSIAHDLIEATIKRGDVDRVRQRAHFEDQQRELALAEKGFEGFLRWQEQTRVEILHTEVSLVSACPEYGGTLDAIGRINGRLIMLDWKTSNGIYEDYLCQVAAYRNLWESGGANCAARGKGSAPLFDIRGLEAFGQPIEEVHLLRVDKQWGGFHHHSWPLELLDLAWDVFRRMAELYPLAKRLKKAL